MRITLAALALLAATAAAQPKRIVFVSGDEEYRSEEALPMLAQIAEAKHGFRTTVLYSIDPAAGVIDPENQRNIPGLEALRAADLMVIFTRFRDLPDEQMRHIVEYVEAGKPVIGIRTATHAFQLRTSPTYARWSWNSRLLYERSEGRLAGWSASLALLNQGARLGSNGAQTFSAPDPLWLPAYTRLDASLACRLNRHWDWAMTVENLADRRIWINATTGAAMEQAPPRTVTLRVSWRF